MKESSITQIFSLLVLGPLIGRFIPLFWDLPVWSLTPRRGAVFVLFCFSFYTVTRNQSVRIRYSDVGVISLLIVLIASISWSPDPGVSMRRGVDLILIFVYYVSLVIYLQRDGAMSRLIQILMVFAVVASIYGLVEVAFGEVSRGLVAYISRNELSRKLLALLPLTVVVTILSKQTMQRAVFALTGILMVIVIPLSGSRSGIVGLGIVLFGGTMLFLQYTLQLPSSRLVAAGIVITSLFIVSVVAGVGTGLIPSRLASIPLTPAAFSPEVLGEKRYEVYKAELRTIRNYWLTGVGYEGFVVLTEDVYGIGAYRAHDLISRVWMAAGIGGVVILLATLGNIFRTYIRRIVTADGSTQLYLSAFFLGLVAMTLAGLANIVITELLWYVLLAIGITGYRPDSY